MQPTQVSAVLPESEVAEASVHTAELAAVAVAMVQVRNEVPAAAAAVAAGIVGIAGIEYYPNMIDRADTPDIDDTASIDVLHLPALTDV